MTHTVSPNSSTKVLVTGANGFVGMWIVQKLLERGYFVRATVRSDSKSGHLLETFKRFVDMLEIVVVDDITKKGAFDETVKGVDAIVHAASPFNYNSGDPNDYIEPAVKGTVGVLQSALKNGKSVRRIVITASVASIFHFNEPNPIVFSEADWNDQSVKEVEDKGKEASREHMYFASKTHAEKAAWKFYNEHKSEVSWDLVTLNPPYVFGPPLQEVSSPEGLNTSNKWWYDSVVKGDNLTQEERVAGGNSYIDPRNLADAHIVALETEEAGDERIIIAAGPFTWQDWLDAANSISPPIVSVPRGKPGSGKVITHSLSFNTEKMSRLLGIEVYSQEQTTRDILTDYVKRGW